MSDAELKDLVLKLFFERRRRPAFTPKPEDFTADALKDEDILAACAQLAEDGLVKWQKIRSFGAFSYGLGSITSAGIQSCEGLLRRSEAVTHMQTVNISGSSNVIVGNNSTIAFNSISDLAKLIDSAKATAEAKAEAKGLLRKFVEHPLVAAVAGGAITLLA